MAIGQPLNAPIIAKSFTSPPPIDSVSPLIAGFYEKPELVSLTRIAALGIIIGSVTLIQQTILTKEVDFKTLTTSSTIGTFVSGIPYINNTNPI